MPHTPGPWIVRDNYYIGRYGRMALAEVKAGDAPADDIDQHKANAALIAAAPDLLAACKALLEDSPYMSDTITCECGENGDGDGGTCCHCIARRAIAKALQP